MKTHFICLLPIIGMLLTGCEPDDNPYDLYPTIRIEEPTAEPEYSTSNAAITVGGIVELARDEVSAINHRTGEQYAAAIAFNNAAREFTWTIPDIALEPGENRIQVSAHFYDNTSHAFISIVRFQ